MLHQSSFNQVCTVISLSWKALNSYSSTTTSANTKSTSLIFSQFPKFSANLSTKQQHDVTLHTEQQHSDLNLHLLVPTHVCLYAFLELQTYSSTRCPWESRGSLRGELAELTDTVVERSGERRQMRGLSLMPFLRKGGSSSSESAPGKLSSV